MKRFLVFLGCVMFLLFSCSREPDQEQPKPNDPVVEGWEETVIDGDGELASSLIHFSIGQDSAAVMRGTASFDGATYTFTVGDRITIALTRDGVETKKVYKVKTTAGDLEYDGDAADAFHWKNKSETIKIRAWSYGSSTSFSTEPVGNTFTLATTQSANYQELLYSPSDDYSFGANGSISLRLYHQLSRVTIQLTQSKSNPESPLTINSITFGNGTLYTKGKFVAPASEGATIGSWTNFTEASGAITPYHDDTYKYSAVMFPHHLAAGTTLFTIVTPDGTFAYKVPSGDGITLEAGKQYNYTINVRDLVAVSTLTIGDIAAYTYDGTAKEPTPTVTDPVSGKVLTKDTHYTLSYTNNTNAGTATCKVTGLGIYSGTISKDFVIEKKPATITLNVSSKSLVDGTSGAITATLSEYDADASISLTNANTDYYTTSNSSLSNGTTTITITGVDVCSAKSFKVEATSPNYTYTSKSCAVTITISALMKPGNYIAYNPLWYVCQYNCASSGAFETSHKTTGSYAWTFSDATSKYGTGNSKSMNGGTYHLPYPGEWSSLMPAHSLTTGYMNLSNPNSTYTETGVKVAKNRSATLGNSTSYWAYNNSDGWTYAVRYVSGSTSINQYCSAWRYKRVSSPCNALCIEAYQLKTAVTNETDAKTVLGLLPGSTVWSGTANVSHTLAPSNSSLVRRYFPCTGYYNSGTGQTNSTVGSGGRFWSCEAYIMLLFDNQNTSDLGIYVLSYDNGNIGRCVRLFRE